MFIHKNWELINDSELLNPDDLNLENCKKLSFRYHDKKGNLNFKVHNKNFAEKQIKL